MNINWKVRFKNKTWLASFIALIVSFIFQIINILGIDIGVSQESIMQVVTAFLSMLAMVGVVQDPTTSGIGDSKNALSYTEPKNTSGGDHLI